MRGAVGSVGLAGLHLLGQPGVSLLDLLGLFHLPLADVVLLGGLGAGSGLLGLRNLGDAVSPRFLIPATTGSPVVALAFLLSFLPLLRQIFPLLVRQRGPLVVRHVPALAGRPEHVYHGVVAVQQGVNNRNLIDASI